MAEKEPTIVSLRKRKNLNWGGGGGRVENSGWKLNYISVLIWKDSRWRFENKQLLNIKLLKYLKLQSTGIGKNKY